ncbi:MAG: M23 family metallopeptidase [Candidatus Paceibacterota bacterium]
MKKVILALILVLTLPVSVLAGTFDILNYNSIVHQGDVLMVKIAPDLKGRDIMIYAFDELYQFNNEGYAFIGVEVGREPGDYIVYLVENSEKGPVQYDFYYTHIKVLAKDFGNPWYAGPLPRSSKEIRERRAKETDIKNKAYALAEAKSDFTEGHFIEPLERIEVTDQFGTQRLYGTYNSRTKKITVQNKISHGGVDLRARSPLPVMAINSGKVLLVHNFSLPGTEGKMIVIDHGSGILSLYLHLSQFRIKNGDTVKKGQVIAMTGATPRGTAPHLHLMIKVHGTNVDPLMFTDNFNRYIER